MNKSDTVSASGRLSLDHHKLLYHLEPLNKWLKGEDIYPIYCSVGLTQMCNHNCIFCVYDSLNREKIYLEKERLLAIMQELASNGLKAVFFSGEGEPLLHPHAEEIISRVKSCGVDCALSTNGILLIPELAENILKDLSYVRVSLNGCSPENYQQIHRASADAYERVLNNLASAVEIKKRQKLSVTIGAQCILLGENIKHIASLVNDLKTTGIDYLTFKPFLPIDTTKYRTKLDLDDQEVRESLRACEQLSDDHFKVVVRWDSFARLKKRTYDKCLSLPFMIEIDSKGDVYPCGVLLGREGFCYGNITTQTFQQIKQSKQYKNVIKKISNELNVHDCMPNCRNDAVNRFLWELRHPPEHVSFI